MLDGLFNGSEKLNYRLLSQLHKLSHYGCYDLKYRVKLIIILQGDINLKVHFLSNIVILISLVALFFLLLLGQCTLSASYNMLLSLLQQTEYQSKETL